MADTLFVLGREPALSVAEIEARLGGWQATPLAVHPEVALVRSSKNLPPGTVDRLGGTVKLASVEECVTKTGDFLADVKRVCTAEWLQSQLPDGRGDFGVSVYGVSRAERQAAQRHFFGLKKELTAAGRPVRLVTSREPQLSAVTVVRQGLLKRGREIVIYRGQQYTAIGATIAVQDYRAYSLRDYGRPAADPKSGMVPPKLAQMMLNIAQVQPDDILLDPFCCSGTILQEALLLGVRRLHGYDTNQRAVKNAQENIRWLFKEFPHLQGSVDIILQDARHPTIRPTVIVTEPDLGPALRGRETPAFLSDQLRRLGRLYLESFQQWAKTLSAGCRVVMIWPEFSINGKPSRPNIAEAVASLGFEPIPLLSSETARVLGVTDRFVLSYGRSDARLRRQIRKWIKR
ncbi:MAG: hypothetical protein HYY50_05055 [Candidatus Kerfeldbacteria bacterium]|nr:hypothetical protein [Candidatus Kerfeldbacteria bacterium]